MTVHMYKSSRIKSSGDRMFRRSNVPKWYRDQMCRRSKIPEIKCSGDQMCQSYLEIKCAGDQKFRRSNVPEITCSGDQMFWRSKIPEIEYSGDQMCQVLMEITNSRRSSVFGDQVCVSLRAGGRLNQPTPSLIPPRCCMGNGRKLIPYDFSFGI